MFSFDLSSLFQYQRDTVAAMPQYFSLANCRSLIIVQRIQGGQVTYTEITPRPIIQTINPATIRVYEGIESIQFELDDLEAHISKQYSIEQIVGRGISYLIDAELVSGQPQGGFEADKVPNTVIQNRDLDWQLILRRRA